MIGIIVWIYYSKNNVPYNDTLLTTQPSKESILQKNTQCTISSSKAATHIFGLSDPSFLDDKVRNFAIELWIQWIRADFRWSDIETETGAYDFSKYDELVKDMRKNKIQIIWIVNDIPKKYNDWNIINTQYEKFIKSLFNRYKNDITYWEVFNEPNLPGYWWLWSGYNGKDYVHAYANILSITNKTLRSIDTDWFLILGWFSPDGENPLVYLQSLYDLGSMKCFDMIWFHPYGFENRLTELKKTIQDISIKNKDIGKPIWFTEFGTTDEKNKQALLSNILKEVNTTDAFFWFSIKDFSPINNFYGLVDFFNNKKEIYNFFKNNIPKE